MSQPVQPVMHKIDQQQQAYPVPHGVVEVQDTELEKESQYQETYPAHHEVGGAGEQAETKIMYGILQCIYPDAVQVAYQHFCPYDDDI